MKKLYLVISLISILFTACKEDDLTNGDRILDPNHINLKVDVPNILTTRGTPIISEKDDLFTQIGIFGYPTQGDIDFNNKPSASLFSNSTVNRDAQNFWDLDRTYFWPQNDVVSFLSYFPYINPSTENSNGLTLIEQSDIGYPMIKYTVPNKVENQPDLMIATPVLNISRETVKLNFNHALACISFDVSGPDVPIDSIYIKGVSTSGNLYMCLNTLNEPYWDKLNEPNETEFKVGLIENPVAEDPLVNIMATDGYLMMIPQVLGENAMLCVKFKDLPVREIPFNTVSTTEWKAGIKYIYTLEEGKYTFDVTCDSIECPYLGGVFNLKVKSLYTKANEVVIDTLGWTTKVTYSDENDKDWVLGIDTINNETGGESINKTLNIGLSPYKSTPIPGSADYDGVLQSKPEYTYQNINDLSQWNNGTQYISANCYMVNAPGWHKFPCWIMGNGLQGNSSEYALRASNLNETCYSKKYTFTDYAGKPIKSAQNLVMSGTDFKAELVWADAPDIISNLEIQKNGSGVDEYIAFYVPTQNIRMGNAVIALKNSNNDIMWSWHIWFSAWSISYFFENVKSDETFYGLNMGFTLPAKYNYPSRSVTIDFIQNVTGITKSITLTQKPEEYTYYSASLYYQWGRKDPFVAAVGISNMEDFSPDNRRLFNSDGVIQFEAKNFGVVDIKTSINNPGTFFLSPSAWCSNVNEELWGIPISEVSVSAGENVYNGIDFYKTIYDPSPNFFSLPPKTMFTSLVKDGWIPFTASYVFKYNSTEESTIIFAALGDRSGTTGNVENITTAGYYWSNSSTLSISEQPTSRKYQYLSIDSVDPQIEENATSAGYNIIPAIYSNPN